MFLQMDHIEAGAASGVAPALTSGNADWNGWNEFCPKAGDSRGNDSYVMYAPEAAHTHTHTRTAIPGPGSFHPFQLANLAHPPTEEITMSGHHALLAEHVRARREALGLTRTDLVKRGGPYSRTVREVEEGAPVLRRVTLWNLDAALDWPDGTAAALYRGQVPAAVTS